MDANAEPLTRNDRIGFQALGAPVIVIGLFFFGLGSWMAYRQWSSVAEWPRTDATLISKEISNRGARLIFQYETGGRRFIGQEFRFGSEMSVRAALESYERGKSQRISYNPDDPSEVDTILSLRWEQFKAPIFVDIFGVMLILGGMVVYRWSKG